jgi:nucleoid-associated protein YgaU
MTRENKLVMVIGFGLLLFVGILVSDHLAARDSQIARPATVVSYDERPLPGAEDLGVTSFGAVPERAADEPAQVDGRPVVLPEPIGFPGGAAFDTTVQMPQVQPPAMPAERTHTVAKGENPEKLAQKYYGKRSLAGKLADYNGIDPTKLKIGQTLKVPDISVLDPNSAPRQAAAEVVQAPVEAAVERTVAQAPPAAKPSTSTLTVKKGDNLWKISERVYGRGSNANVQKLRELNPGLSDRNLKVGSQIKVVAMN